MRTIKYFALASALLLLLTGCGARQPEATRQIFAMDTVMDLYAVGEGAEALLTEAAQEIQQKANANVAEGEGFSCNTWMGAYGGGRWVASVTTTDKASRKAEAEDKALSRAVT